MRPSVCVILAVLLVQAGVAAAQTKPTQATQPVPSGGVVAVKPTDGSVQPRRSILYIPQFAPPGTQVPGGPPASDTPTLITPSVLGPTVLGIAR